MVNRPDSKKARQKRHTRVRAKISGTAECPRLNVFRSLQHIYAQIIDDVSGKTLVSASTVEKDFEDYGGNKSAARKVGITLAKTFITAVFRNWPKAPVRAASTSKEREDTFG